MGGAVGERPGTGGLVEERCDVRLAGEMVVGTDDAKWAGVGSLVDEQLHPVLGKPVGPGLSGGARPVLPVAQDGKAPEAGFGQAGQEAVDRGGLPAAGDEVAGDYEDVGGAYRDEGRTELLHPRCHTGQVHVGDVKDFEWLVQSWNGELVNGSSNQRASWACEQSTPASEAIEPPGAVTRRPATRRDRAGDSQAAV